MENEDCEHEALCEEDHGMGDWYRCGICDDCGDYIED